MPQRLCTALHRVDLLGSSTPTTPRLASAAAVVGAALRAGGGPRTRPSWPPASTCRTRRTRAVAVSSSSPSARRNPWTRESPPDRRADLPRRRCRPRRIDPTGPRPSELLAAFFSAALVMLAAAAAAAVAYAATGDARLHWLALHLALLGGVSQLVLGAGQFFVCAFLATTPPSRRLVGAQLGIWNTGTLLVATGVPAAADALVDAGGVLIAAGLALFAASMRAMQQRSLQRARWAVRWYQCSAACLAAGVLVGILLARAVSWPHGSLLGAHLALNIAGWLGTAIIGTLHTFFPSLTATQLRYPRLQGPTLALWLLGVLELAFAAALNVDALAVAAWVQLTAAAVLLAVNLLASLRARAIALSLPARLVASGQAFLPRGSRWRWSPPSATVPPGRSTPPSARRWPSSCSPAGSR